MAEKKAVEATKKGVGNSDDWTFERSLMAETDGICGSMEREHLIRNLQFQVVFLVTPSYMGT